MRATGRMVFGSSKGTVKKSSTKHLVKPASTIPHQLTRFYSDQTIDSLLQMVIGFRMMHLHGRVLHDLIPKAVDNIEDYVWRDGELVCGVVLGWNFGDGHLHREPMLEAVQDPNVILNLVNYGVFL